MSQVVRKPLFPMQRQMCILAVGYLTADQHLCFCYMYIHVDSTIPLFYKFEIPGTLPFPVAGQLGLCLTWSGTPKSVFLTTVLIFYLQLLRNLSHILL